MRLFRWRVIAGCLLYGAVSCWVAWADEPVAAEKKAAAADDGAANDAEDNEKSAEKSALARKAPQRIPPALNPHSFEIPVPRRFPDPAANLPPVKKQPAAKEKNADQPLRPDARQPLPRQPLPRQQPPQQRRMNAGAAFRLGNMGRNAHLTPAMRYYLNRTGSLYRSSGLNRPGSGANLSPTSRSHSSTANAVDHGARNFYPGVSRLPAQKPFVNIKQPATALDRYWPLLLEGRQDPNTGLIIWRLP